MFISKFIFLTEVEDKLVNENCVNFDKLESGPHLLFYPLPHACNAGPLFFL